jgi:hypothetical protein
MRNDIVSQMSRHRAVKDCRFGANPGAGVTQRERPEPSDVTQPWLWNVKWRYPLKKVTVVVVENGSFFPFLKLPIAWNQTVVHVECAIDSALGLPAAL